MFSQKGVIMKQILTMLYFFLLIHSVSIYSRDVDQKWNDIKNQVVTTAQNTWDGASGFIKGMGQSFGFVTADYHYSLLAWNDAPAPIFVAIQHVTPVLGADFSGNLANSAVVMPNDTSGTTFYKQQLYISVWLCADAGRADIQQYSTSPKGTENLNIGGGGEAIIKGLFGGIVTTEKLKKYSLLRQDIYPWPAHDDNIYYYRTYTDAGQVKGEYLGIKATTQEFIGTFYNSSTANDVTLTFSKDEKSYTVSLEPESFSLLQSTTGKPTSIRPAKDEKRAFVFAHKDNVIGYLPIASEGIANVSFDEKTKKYDPAGSMMYTYEVYDNKGALSIGMQGLSVGNFKQPTERVRDINPVECHIWYQSAAQAEAIDKKMSENQAKEDYSAIPFDTPETLWVTYKTHDFTVVKKVARGSVLDFELIRPQIAEKEAWLYGVLLNTQDDKKAQQFLDRLSSGKIAPESISTAITQSLKHGLMETKKNNIIDDTKGKDNSGVIGYLLLADYFTPHGITEDTFYYYVEPAELRIDQLINAFYFDDSYYIKNSAGQITLQDAVQKEIAEKIPQWISSYPTNKNAVTATIKEYMQQKGNKGLFVNPTAQPSGRTFSSQGQHIFDMFISGPISIENYPIIRKAGINYYIYGLGAKPSQWLS